MLLAIVPVGSVAFSYPNTWEEGNQHGQPLAFAIFSKMMKMTILNQMRELLAG